MHPSFKAGAREGLRAFMPLSVGLVPWAIVTGLAMRAGGLSIPEALAMQLMVYAGTAQLGVLPLLFAGAPMWLILLTTLALNLRMLIFSAAMAPGFRGVSLAKRSLGSAILVDGVFAVCTDRMIKSNDSHWRWGFYIAPSIYGWVLWQSCALVGIIGAGSIPPDWSLEFMVTIALMVMLVPMTTNRPMLIAAVTSGLGALLLHDLPLRLGMMAGMVIGMVCGYLAERRVKELAC